jgi:hypothetical protein
MSAASLDVSYVCLSDLHLGEPDSILTPLEPGSHEVDTTVAGPLLEQLVACLQHVLGGNRGDHRPVLILNGDALELAFGSFSQALTNFERLARLLVDRELIERVVYIPGNHDHHIWEVARETQYASTIAGGPREGGLPPLRHVTSVRPEDAVPAYLLNKIIEGIHAPGGAVAAETGPEVLVVYPNLVIASETDDRCVLFHHGHYVEPLYHAFSKLRRWVFPDRDPPRTIDEVEEENFAWIEFVWSLLGRSGGAGTDMRALFRMLRDDEEFAAFTDSLARRVAAERNIPWVPGDALERVVLKRAFVWVGSRLSGERSRREVVLSDELRRGIQDYLFGPALRQLQTDLGGIPSDLTFVLGHTHKPFEALVSDRAGGREVRVYNTGGWPIDSRRPSGAIGASILFMNASLHAACLRVYNDSDRDGNVSLDVRRASDDEPGDDFRAAIESRVREPGRGRMAAPWEALDALIREAIARRRRKHAMDGR